MGAGQHSRILPAPPFSQTSGTSSRAIETNLKQAAKWNPTDASYKTLSTYWNWVLDTDWDMQL